jgi:hypothetical protein
MAAPDFNKLRQSIADLLRFFAQAAHIPRDAAAFERCYGAFDEPAQVARFVRLCVEIDAIAGALGGPVGVKAQLARDPDYLYSDARPAEFYARIVQLAAMTQTGASTFAETLSLFATLPGDAETRSAAIKTAVAGPGGLVATAVTVRDAALLLAKDMAPLLPRLADAFAALSATRILNAANQALGALQARMQRLTADEREAREKWDGAILRKGAAEQAYREAKQAREDAEAAIARKQALADDMNGFFTAGNAMVVASRETQYAIEAIGNAFGDARDTLMNVSTAASAEQLGDPAWLARAIDLPTEIERWRTLAADAGQFVQSALIDAPAAAPVL